MISINSVSGYTGYPNFKEITFNNDGKLLVDMEQSEIDNGFKKLGKRRLFGWKVHYFNLYEEVTFIGEEIFARSNRTSTPYEFDYYLKELDYSERSRKATGTINAKTKGKIKKFDYNLDAEIKGERDLKIVLP